ncbi:MAG TPA: sigma-70 family RNA polymerase sigma factor [Ktedonobacteraceae bacterium]|nr:sigma-70 family RNA polymerase sigma factor [Ktedonobacteraceae bacterium]
MPQRRRPIVQEPGSNAPLETRHACTADLYQLYAPAVFAYIRHHTADLNDAEDILAEVFAGALRQDLTVMSADEQRAWLWAVARNKVNDHYRQGQRRQQVSLESLGEILEDATTPEQLALQQEEMAYLHSYMQRLSATQQEVLQLRFTGGLRCTEIAALLNKREGAIRSILSRALNELRKYYER